MIASLQPQLPQIRAVFFFASSFPLLHRRANGLLNTCVADGPLTLDSSTTPHLRRDSSRQCPWPSLRAPASLRTPDPDSRRDGRLGTPSCTTVNATAANRRRLPFSASSQLHVGAAPGPKRPSPVFPASRLRCDDAHGPVPDRPAPSLSPPSSL